MVKFGREAIKEARLLSHQQHLDCHGRASDPRSQGCPLPISRPLGEIAEESGRERGRPRPHAFILCYSDRSKRSGSARRGLSRHRHWSWFVRHAAGGGRAPGGLSYCLTTRRGLVGNGQGPRGGRLTTGLPRRPRGRAAHAPRGKTGLPRAGQWPAVPGVAVRWLRCGSAA